MAGGDKLASGLAHLALPVLQRLDPESAHALIVQALAWYQRFRRSQARAPAVHAPQLACRLFGHALDNPIGMAAGFDKDAVVPDALLALGFGFVEVGSVTPLPQPGNPRPRVFRLREDEALINRLGFNSLGLDHAERRLGARRDRPGLVGVNLGANAKAADWAADYLVGLQRLGPLAGYIVVNVSSPNTPGLRALQGRDALDRLVVALGAARRDAGIGAPLLLKVAPDLAPGDAEAIAEIALARGVAGLVVSNTTTGHRRGLRSASRHQAGGLSGRPLLAPATALLGQFYRLTEGRLTLIGVGGIASGADAYAKIRAGASAVQLYTALAYRGIGLLARIKRDLAARLAADGFAGVAAAVGADWPRAKAP